MMAQLPTVTSSAAKTTSFNQKITGTGSKSFAYNFANYTKKAEMPITTTTTTIIFIIIIIVIIVVISLIGIFLVGKIMVQLGAMLLFIRLLY